MFDIMKTFEELEDAFIKSPSMHKFQLKFETCKVAGGLVYHYIYIKSERFEICGLGLSEEDAICDFEEGLSYEYKEGDILVKDSISNLCKDLSGIPRGDLPMKNFKDLEELFRKVPPRFGYQISYKTERSDGITHYYVKLESIYFNVCGSGLSEVEAVSDFLDALRLEYKIHDWRKYTAKDAITDLCKGLSLDVEGYMEDTGNQDATCYIEDPGGQYAT